MAAEIKTNLAEIKMTFKTNEEAANVGDVIYHTLAGIDDYVNNAIVLNITDNVITLIIGDEAQDKVKAGLLGLSVFKALKGN